MRKSLLLGSLALVAGAADAGPLLGLYAGVGVTNTSVDNLLSTGVDFSKDSQWKGFVGLKPPGSPLGVEAEYVDFGSGRYDVQQGGLSGSGHAQGSAYALHVVGYIPVPLPSLWLTAKVGVARWDVSSHALLDGPSASILDVHDHASQLTWGVGAQGHFGRIGVRFEYERFNIAGSDGAHVVTLGASYTFL